MQRMLVLSAGAVAGVALAPFVLDAFRIPSQPGFGMEEVISALVVVAAVLAADAIL